MRSSRPGCPASPVPLPTGCRRVAAAAVSQPANDPRLFRAPAPRPPTRGDLRRPPLQVNVYGFGADSRGNWHHYWENNRYAGEFRKTGVHDADFEAHIIDMLAKASKIEVYRGN